MDTIHLTIVMIAIRMSIQTQIGMTLRLEAMSDGIGIAQGGGEKRYPADSDVALLRGTIQCNGYHIMSHDNVVCGYPSIDLKSCEIYWNPLIRPSGACQVRGCESIVLGKDPSQECR